VRARWSAENPGELAARRVETSPETPIAYEIGVAAYEIIAAEEIAAVPEPPLVCNPLEGARYRDKLSRMTEFPSPERAREVLTRAFIEFVYSIPNVAEDGPFFIPLIELLENPGATIEALILPLDEEDGLFVSLKRRLDDNALRASGGKRILPPTAYNRGAILLVDTNKGLLGAKNSSYMGRIAITLVLQALLERAAMPAGSYKTPTFLIIDEAGEYFDKSIDAILTEARKQNAGLLMAHQYFGQMTSELRASVASNTSIKFAGGLSAADARAAALDMRTTPEFILAQEPLSFACYLRGVTPKAVSLKVAYGLLEDHARMSEAAYRALRQRNRERVTCALPEEEKKPPLSSAEAATKPPPPQEADPTAPQQWG
jgi:hypothetical protein